MMEDKIELLELRIQSLENIVSNLIKEQLKIKHNEFVGLEITDFYCNGFFGRDYDLEGAKIIENTDKRLTIRKENGEILQADMDGWNMRDYVNEWTKEKEDDE